MKKIPTLYSNYQELLLDLDIFGTIISSPQISRADMKEMLFKEFQKTHPIPTLEDTRYELSNLVSSDFHITYNSEIELKANEELVSVSSSVNEDYSVVSDVDVEIQGGIPAEVSVRFGIHDKITDSIRQDIKNSLDYFKVDDIEDFGGSIAKVEEVFNTVGDSHEVFYEDDVNEFEDNDDSEADDDSYEDFSADDEGLNEEESDESEDDDSDDECYDFSSDDEQSDDDDDDISSDDSESVIDDSDDENDSEDSDEDYDDFSADDSDEDSDDDSDDAYEDFSAEGEDEENEEDSQVVESVTQAHESHNMSIDSVFDVPDEIEFIPKEDITRVVEVPKVPIKPIPPSAPTIQETVKVNREEEPKTLREFLRKYPHSEVTFVLKYFSKKEIQQAIMTGKIIKKGSKLHI